MNNREIGIRKRKLIVDMLYEHPEGLTTAEIHKGVKDADMSYDATKVYMRQLYNSGSVSRIESSGISKTYIHNVYQPGASVVDEYFLYNKLRRQDTLCIPEDSEDNSAYRLLKLLERYEAPVSFTDFVKNIEDTFDVRDTDRIRKILRRFADVDVVTIHHSDKGELYHIPFPDRLDRSRIDGVYIPIARLLNRYKRYTIYSGDGSIPYKDVLHISDCVRHIEEVRYTTLKDICIKIRVYVDREWEYTIHITNEEYYIRYTHSSDVLLLTHEELIDFLEAREEGCVDENRS